MSTGKCKKEPPPGGSFLRLSSPGGGFKRRGPKPPPLSLQGDRILKERGKFEIPLSLSGVLWLLSFDTERKQLAPAGATPSLPQAKKEAPAGPEAFIFPAAAGDIYFVRADRRGLIKRKKERPRRKAIFTIPPAAAGGLYIYPPRQRGIFILSAPLGQG